MPIFFMLNGLGLVFLLYVLVNFWIEGKRTKKRAWRDAIGRDRTRDFEPIMANRPISHTAQGGISVIPLRALTSATKEKPVRRLGVHEVVEMPLKGISANSAVEGLPRRAKIAAKDGPRC